MVERVAGCSCGAICLERDPEPVSFNWSPDCTVHGVGTEWYDDPERVQTRAEQNERLRDLQLKARAARAAARKEAYEK